MCITTIQTSRTPLITTILEILWDLSIGLHLEYKILQSFFNFRSYKIVICNTETEMNENGENVVLTQKENLSHFDLNAGIRLHF